MARSLSVLHLSCGSERSQHFLFGLWGSLSFTQQPEWSFSFSNCMKSVLLLATLQWINDQACNTTSDTGSLVLDSRPHLPLLHSFHHRLEPCWTMPGSPSTSSWLHMCPSTCCPLRSMSLPLLHWADSCCFKTEAGGGETRPGHLPVDRAFLDGAPSGCWL